MDEGNNPKAISTAKPGVSDPGGSRALSDNYVIIGPLVETDLSVVEIIREVETGRHLLAKSLKGASAAVQERFHNAILEHGRLQHKNIIQTVDWRLSDSGEPVFITEFVEGVNLDQLIDEVGTLEDDEEITTFLIQVCDALEYAHSEGLIHGGLSPSNVVITQPDENILVKIADFGAVNRSRELPENADRVIAAYTAPESKTGVFSEKSDVFSVAAVAYQLITGYFPYGADGEASELAPISDYRPDIPEAEKLSFVLERALQLDPDERTSSVRDFKRGVREWYQAIGEIDDEDASGEFETAAYEDAAETESETAQEYEEEGADEEEEGIGAADEEAEADFEQEQEAGAEAEFEQETSAEYTDDAEFEYTEENASQLEQEPGYEQDTEAEQESEQDADFQQESEYEHETEFEQAAAFEPNAEFEPYLQTQQALADLEAQAADGEFQSLEADDGGYEDAQFAPLEDQHIPLPQTEYAQEELTDQQAAPDAGEQPAPSPSLDGVPETVSPIGIIRKEPEQRKPAPGDDDYDELDDLDEIDELDDDDEQSTPPVAPPATISQTNLVASKLAEAPEVAKVTGFGADIDDHEFAIDEEHYDLALPEQEVAYTPEFSTPPGVQPPLPPPRDPVIQQDQEFSGRYSRVERLQALPAIPGMEASLAEPPKPDKLNADLEREREREQIKKFKKHKKTKRRKSKLNSTMTKLMALRSTQVEQSATVSTKISETFAADGGKKEAPKTVVLRVVATAIISVVCVILVIANMEVIKSVWIVASRSVSEMIGKKNQTVDETALTTLPAEETIAKPAAKKGDAQGQTATSTSTTTGQPQGQSAASVAAMSRHQTHLMQQHKVVDRRNIAPKYTPPQPGEKRYEGAVYPYLFTEESAHRDLTQKQPSDSEIRTIPSK